MSDQFNFEEINAIDWLKDASQWTDKHPLTLSQVSKQHFFDVLLDQEVDLKSVPHHKSIVHQKEKKNMNAKNYRDKKKNQLQTMKKEIELLQQENSILKSQKYCKWCKKSFAPNVICTTKHEQDSKNKQSTFEKSTEMQFQPLELFTKKRDARTGKLWVAIGIIMLVLGLTMWGFEGDKSYISKIEVQKQQVSKWFEQVSQREKHQYMQVNYRIKQQNNPNSKSQGSGIRLEFTSPTQRDQQMQQEQVSINKDLLFSIHAELEDIGFYI